MFTLLIFGLLFLLLGLGVPIAFAMGIAGVVGFSAMVGLGPSLAMSGQVIVDNVSSYNLSVLPLFIAMGALFSHSRMAEELYQAFNAFIGHRRGGLAIVTILSCGAFGAVSGSSVSAASTMTRVAVPIMERHGYSSSFAAATVAAGSTLDILIPPSVSMVVFSMLTNVNLGELMMAGFLPGAVMIAIFILAVAAMGVIRPGTMPVGERSDWRARMRSLSGVWAIGLVLMVTFGGIYLGVFTPTEAGGIGATSALVLATLRGRMTMRHLLVLLIQTARTTTTIFMMMIGGMVFANFVTVSGSAAAFEGWIVGLSLDTTSLLLLLLVGYVVLGAFMDASAMMMLSVPILLPVIVGAGVDPVWFGIFVIVAMGMGLVTPPIGMLIFAMKSFAPHIPISGVYLNILPYVAAQILSAVIFIFFPQIVTIVPDLMR